MQQAGLLSSSRRTCKASLSTHCELTSSRPAHAKTRTSSTNTSAATPTPPLPPTSASKSVQSSHHQLSTWSQPLTSRRSAKHRRRPLFSARTAPRHGTGGSVAHLVGVLVIMPASPFPNSGLVGPDIRLPTGFVSVPVLTIPRGMPALLRRRRSLWPLPSLFPRAAAQAQAQAHAQAHARVPASAAPAPVPPSVPAPLLAALAPGQASVLVPASTPALAPAPAAPA